MVDFSNFQNMDPEARDVVQDLMLHAQQLGSNFMSFISVWMAFNGWMASVTEEDTDAKMVNALASNARLTKAFESLMKGSPQFRDDVAEFSS